MMNNNNPLKKLNEFGQSCWLDYIRRDMVRNGDLAGLIERDGISGITSNPAIFEKAIVHSDIYDEAIRSLARKGLYARQIYDRLSLEDVGEAADLFRPVYDRTGGRDGFVSLEVNPHLARDTEGSIDEARRLWHELNRPNVMIKIPATLEGLPAITQLISDAINVNVTLIFSLSRYDAVMAAYIEGLERRIAKGQQIEGIASVASFFLSRIDTLLDITLNHKATKLKGKTAIACAKVAYQAYQRRFSKDDFTRLSEKGAKPQRLLWASTSTKDPMESDIKYVEPLIGPGTVNTMPVETMNAYRDHGNPANRIGEGLSDAIKLLDDLASAGIDLEAATRELESEGLSKFNQPFDRLIQGISEIE